MHKILNLNQDNIESTRQKLHNKPDFDSVQALVKSQADYYAECDRLFNDLVITNPSKNHEEENLYQDEIARNLSIIKSLSIVTDENFKPVPL